VSADDLVFFDCGASIRGYGSDTGRTLTLCEPTREARQIMDALRRGMDAAFALVNPGARMCDIFEAGQNAVRAAGLDWYTRGHIGHAMGLGMGEMPPFLAPGETRVLEPGMVMALETPLYLRGLGGFQIEECFVVTDTGYEPMTSLPRDFLRATA
jgi:Xaa-Pro aminopeptidase